MKSPTVTMLIVIGRRNLGKQFCGFMIEFTSRNFAIDTDTYPLPVAMDNYDSDSSAGDDIETNVLLGYASKEPTSDDFSQLGGHPVRIQCFACRTTA